MPKFYVNRDASHNPNNDHEIHKEGCSWMPNSENAIFLGNFPSCHEALAKAKNDYWRKSDGCKNCCKECHHG